MNECNIIRDILPLYAEGMVSEDTKEFTEAHLKNCGECRNELEKMREPEAVQETGDTVPLVGIRKKLAVKRIQTVILTVVLVLAIAVTAFSYITKPRYFAYTDNLLTVTEIGDGSVVLTFREDVTSYMCESMDSPDDPLGKYYMVEAWTTLLEQWTDEKPEKGTMTVYPQRGAAQMTIYYVQNNGQEDVCIYGKSVTNGGIITLPRLALNYYLFIMFVVMAVLFVCLLIFRKNTRVKTGLERALLFPVSYIISHAVICGVGGATYTMTRDFEFILLVTILLYCVLLLVHNVIRIRKEVKDYI